MLPHRTRQPHLKSAFQHKCLGGRLSVTMTGDFSSAPTRFTLLLADTFDVNHNTFDSKSINYPTGQGWTPQISLSTIILEVMLTFIWIA